MEIGLKPGAIPNYSDKKNLTPLPRTMLPMQCSGENHSFLLYSCHKIKLLGDNTFRLELIVVKLAEQAVLSASLSAVVKVSRATQDVQQLTHEKHVE